MGFKKWLEQTGPPTSMTDKQEPVEIAKYYNSAIPYYDMKPLPGNQKYIKKRMKKK